MKVHNYKDIRMEGKDSGRETEWTVVNRATGKSTIQEEAPLSESVGICYSQLDMDLLD